MEITTRIKEVFDLYFDAPLDAWKSFTDLGELITTEKDQILKHNNTIENYLYFVVSGSGGILIWNKNNFVCIDLCYENDFFGDYMSFLTERPSPIEVVTFEKSKLFRISKTNFKKLSDNIPHGINICRFASEGLFIHKQEQQINILTKTAHERYLELLKKQPEIILRTPQKYIASYLGITPQSLSRIRNKITEQ